MKYNKLEYLKLKRLESDIQTGRAQRESGNNRKDGLFWLPNIKNCESMYSLSLLLELGADVDYLQDIVIGRELQWTDVDLRVVPEELFSQVTNFFGPRRWPHQYLPIRLEPNKTKVKHMTCHK